MENANTIKNLEPISANDYYKNHLTGSGKKYITQKTGKKK